MNRVTAALTITLLISTMPASILASEYQSWNAKLPIVLTLFLHDELSDTDIRNLDTNYFSWFTEDLESITDRKVEIVPILRTPGYTDFDYRLGDAGKSLYEWDQRVIDYVIGENKPRSKRHKYLLITRDNLTLLTEGIAGSGKRSAIASLSAYRTIAHEVGHLLGATHSDGQLIGFPFALTCNTNMVASEVFFIKNCYRYSDRAKQSIRNYLKDTP
ncbi:hypothetical protein [Pseudomonas sp. LP_7_YM]|uniref:hypothetical protein n=1 Tax=Pseudomonas sp. LP_7_YM TaxID=2485137 RepID=UPI00105E92FD|nr:hypothetical protein [Pseudomonas sp. LP_7_YM]TDV64359.1 hypothetical protein EC915_10562 [Pseudomonas sp. LP_7_YM]